MTTRDKLLETLDEIGRQYPEMRLGQLISFLCVLAGEEEPRNVYDVEDEELYVAALHHLAQRARPDSGGSVPPVVDGIAKTGQTADS